MISGSTEDAAIGDLKIIETGVNDLVQDCVSGLENAFGLRAVELLGPIVLTKN